MADWNKLNKEFDEALNNMTPEKWREWKLNRDKRKIMKKYELEIQIGYRRFNHTEMATCEYDARYQTTKLAASRFGVNIHDVKVNSCKIIEEKPKNSLEFLKTIFGFK